MRIVVLNNFKCCEISENYSSLFRLFYGLRNIFHLPIQRFFLTENSAYVLFVKEPEIKKSIPLNIIEKEELNFYKLYLEAEILAKNWHGSQLYGGFIPYFFHLKQTDKVIDNFSRDIPQKQYFKLKTAALLHDVLEDTPITYNKLQSLFGNEIADIVLKVTKINEINTKEFEASYYEEMAKNPCAVFVKIADKAANAKQTLKDKSLWHAERLVQGHALFQSYTYNKIKAPLLKKYLDCLILRLGKICDKLSD